MIGIWNYILDNLNHRVFVLSRPSAICWFICKIGENNYGLQANLKLTYYMEVKN